MTRHIRGEQPPAEFSCGCQAARSSGDSLGADSTGDGGTYVWCKWCGKRWPLGRGAWTDPALGERYFWPGEHQRSAWSTYKGGTK